jgi:amidophosphoribosyltransferase
MCGITGILSPDKDENIIHELYDSLFHIQHRGQDAFGMYTYSSHSNKFSNIKQEGLLSNNISIQTEKLQGNIGVGHVRYPTSGIISCSEIQPFFVNRPYGISLCHNGHIQNKEELREILVTTYNLYLDTTSDSEVILYLFSIELDKELNGNHSITERSIQNVLCKISTLLQGSYSIIMIIAGYGIIFFKDKYGIRPLLHGKRDNNHLISSESISLDNLDYDFQDVNAGEYGIITLDGHLHKAYYCENYSLTPCIFEWIYISRIESVIHNIPVIQARLEMGKLLSKKIRETVNIDDIDFIIPVPETSKPCALSMSDELNIPYTEGIIKNRYINRTFIMGNNQTRNKNIKRKLNIINSQVNGKNVIIVDDSIVRGNTMRHIVKLLKKNGVNKVIVVSCSPMIRFPNIYGIDVSSHKELISHKHSIEDIEKEMGIDKLIYQDLDDLLQLFHKLNPNIQHYETSLFNGIYLE